MSRSASEVAQDFVGIWDASSPTGLSERTYAPDYIEHSPLPGQGPGIEGVNQLADVYFAVFPDLRTRVDAVLNDGEFTVVRWTGEGTHEGDQMGMPPTHRKITFHGIDILRMVDGKVAEHWGETNGLDVMQQLQGA